MTLRRLARRFRRDKTGATAVEFSLIGVPFLATIFAIFELAYVSFESEQLSAGVFAGARAMLTGRAQALNISTASQFVSTYLCAPGSRLVPSNFDCSKLVVDLRPAASFVGNNLSNDLYKATDNKYCPGAPGQIVVMRVAYPLRAIFPLDLMNPQTGVVSDVPGQSGMFHILVGQAVFQGEPYTTGFTPAPGC